MTSSSPHLYQQNSPLSTTSTPIISPVDSQSSSVKLSKARMIQNYLKEHVPQWQNDVLIQSLFANLPNREVKPEAFTQKYSFWKDLLISLTRNRLLGGSVFKFPSKDISIPFHRGGLQPVCLNGVIHEMIHEDLVQDASIDLISSTSSSPVFGVLNWILGSLKTLVIGSTTESMDSTDGMEFTIPNQLLVHSLLKEQEELILDELNSHNHHIPLTFEEFHDMVNASRRREGLVEIVEKDDILLLLRFLKSKGLLNYSPLIEVVSDKVMIAIKLKASSPITQVDFDIVKLKKLQSRLSLQVHDLSDRIRDLTDLARKTLLSSNDRKMALYQLKRRKLLEQVQDERLKSLHTLDDILFRICSISDDEQILEAYKAGSKALKQLLPNADAIEETVDQLQELMAEHEEISHSLNQAMSPNIDYSEFEDDLKALIEVVVKEPEVESTLSPKATEVINTKTEEDSFEDKQRISELA